MTLLFESKTCTRCGGSGEYSWCQRHGSMCFKCRGKGEVLTKRGQAAQSYLHSLYTKPASEIKVGDFLQEEHVYGGGNMTRFFAAVTKVEVKEGGVIISTEHPKMGKCQNHRPTDSAERIGQSAEEKTAKRQIALEYQATLTKQGKVSKRKVKAA